MVQFNLLSLNHAVKPFHRILPVYLRRHLSQHGD